MGKQLGCCDSQTRVKEKFNPHGQLLTLMLPYTQALVWRSIA